MAGVKISQLPAIVTPALTDIFPVVQSGTTYKETMTQLASLISSNISASSITNTMLAQMGAYTIKGNNTNATANPQDIAAGQYPATHTNDDATAGNVGEFISSDITIGAPVAFTDSVIKDLTSISLTAGDWDVWGNIIFAPSIQADSFVVWTNSVSATLPDHSFSQFAFTITGSAGSPAPYRRYSLAAPTTIYISAEVAFAAGNCFGYGGIYARRAR